jgi:hypothetical protein
MASLCHWLGLGVGVRVGSEESPIVVTAISLGNAGVMCFSMGVYCASQTIILHTLCDRPLEDEGRYVLHLCHHRGACPNAFLLRNLYQNRGQCTQISPNRDDVYTQSLCGDIFVSAFTYARVHESQDDGIIHTYCLTHVVILNICLSPSTDSNTNH